MIESPLVNHAPVVAELTARHEAYERALMSNDIGALTAFFWDSPHALRFGAMENLYGSAEIVAFRKARPALNLARAESNFRVVTFGTDTGITTLEFSRTLDGVTRHGRQSQFWRKLPEGWKVVSAHVSFMGSPTGGMSDFMDYSARALQLPIAPEYRDGVLQDLMRSASIAAFLMDFPLTEDTESAPVFQP